MSIIVDLVFFTLSNSKSKDFHHVHVTMHTSAEVTNNKSLTRYCNQYTESHTGDTPKIPHSSQQHKKLELDSNLPSQMA